jgi:hypothetical protein
MVVMNSVTPKAAANHNLLFNKPAFGFHGNLVEHLSQTYAAQQSVYKVQNNHYCDFCLI